MNLLGDISTATWLFALFGAFSLGFSKTGFPGLAMVNVLILAELFGAKASVGMIVPMLIVCDLTVYPIFRRYSSWRELWPLLPSTFVGLAAGYFLLDYIAEPTARKRGALRGRVALRWPGECWHRTRQVSRPAEGRPSDQL